MRPCNSGWGKRLSGLGRASVWIGAAVWLGGCASRAAREYPELAEYAGRRVADVDFSGSAPFGEDTLQSVVRTQASGCSLLGIPLCIPFTSIGRHEVQLEPGVVADDVDRLALFYRREGYFGTQVGLDIEEREDSAVLVLFEIDRTEAVILDTLTVGGLDGVMDADSLTARLPLRPGEIFNLREFAASADTVLDAMQARGHARAELLRNFTVDLERGVAVANLEAVPGPRVTVDSIVVVGAENLGRATALRQLELVSGDLLRADRLVRGQRNLYSLDIVQFATVSVAPDSLQVSPADSTTATVMVRIAEAPVHQVDAAVGFGTVECLRVESGWESRSFLGGARTLAVSASVSKLGIGAGLGGSLCRAFEQDTLSSSLDYRVTTTLTQPYFLTARNAITLNVYAERQSEASVFQRTAQGSRIALSRRLDPRSVLSAGFDVERGSTIGSPALFCGAFEVCDPETIAVLTQPRFRNTVSVSWFRDRAVQPLNPIGGYQARSSVAWAPPWLLSDVTFVRWTGDVSYYRTLAQGWIGAAALRLGTFFESASPGEAGDFLPPEERFFAGGANTVRGFDRNGLGPGVYVAAARDSLGEPVRDEVTGELVPDLSSVRFVPSGGTSLVVGNLEVRFPSPVFSDLIRLAAFVDAGAIGVKQLLNTGLSEVRATPGFGIRATTPVGPVRIDIAYNPHPRPVGPLFVADPQTGNIERVSDSFRSEPGGLFSKLRLHLAVGQAF